MNILIDTSILVSRESNRAIQKKLQEVSRQISSLNYHIWVHPLSLAEIDKDKNIPSKNVLLSKAKAYPPLGSKSNPYDDKNFFKLIPKPKNEREKIDCYLLYCIYLKEADLFLTEDIDILGKAESLNFSSRVMNLRDASDFFRKALNKRSKDKDVPTFCFYKLGEKWHIGEIGKEGIFDDLSGFKYIHFLLSYENKGFSPVAVYHCGKTPDDENRPAPLILEKGNMDLETPLVNKRLSGKDRELLELKISQIEDEIDSGRFSPEEIMLKKEEIEQIEKYMNEKPGRDHTSQSARARVNLTRAIKKALKKISEDETIASIHKYINESTIKTGYTCFYKPFPNDKPSWILHPQS